MKIEPLIYSTVKAFLSKAIPRSKHMQYLSFYPELEKWRKLHKEPHPFFKNRYLLYDYLNSLIRNNGPISYLEFGVYNGDSIRYWSNINTHKMSVFRGFDTFTGLPEKWELFSSTLAKGAFDMNGKFPVIADERVSFVRGLFQDTLSGFLKGHPPSPPLVINIDSDLYSSALYVLTRCNDILVPGSIVIFDEFSVILEEFKALQDYCSAYLRGYEVLGATKSWEEYYSQVAIRIKQ